MSSGGKFVARSPAVASPRNSPGSSRRPSTKGKQTVVEPEHVQPIKQKKKAKKIVHHKAPDVKSLGLGKPGPQETQETASATADGASSPREEERQPWDSEVRSPLSEVHTPSPGFSLGEDEEAQNVWGDNRHR